MNTRPAGNIGTRVNLTLPDDVLFKGILDQLIQQETLKQATTDLSTRHTATLENEQRGYVSGVAIERVVAEAVTETVRKLLSARLT